jgi:hypothetical protein
VSACPDCELSEAGAVAPIGCDDCRDWFDGSWLFEDADVCVGATAAGFLSTSMSAANATTSVATLMMRSIFQFFTDTSASSFNGIGRWCGIQVTKGTKAMVTTTGRSCIEGRVRLQGNLRSAAQTAQKRFQLIAMGINRLLLFRGARCPRCVSQRRLFSVNT